MRALEKPAVLAALCLSWIAWAGPKPPGADTVVLHARIYTLDPAKPWAEALAIKGEKILAVGSEAEIAKLQAKDTRVIDARGRLVLPGLADCHIHFLDGALSLGRVNLEGAKNPEEIVARLREYGQAHPGEGWILGRGWN